MNEVLRFIKKCLSAASIFICVKDINSLLCALNDFFFTLLVSMKRSSSLESMCHMIKQEYRPKSVKTAFLHNGA